MFMILQNLAATAPVNHSSPEIVMISSRARKQGPITTNADSQQGMSVPLPQCGNPNAAEALWSVAGMMVSMSCLRALERSIPRCFLIGPIDGFTARFGIRSW
jgi:hypothetical protein